MVLITGGAYQGKLDYGFRLLGQPVDRQLYADGGEDPFGCAMERQVVAYFHLYVRRLMEEGRPVEAFIQEMAEKNLGALVIADEVGCGIVPVDPGDRAYREAAGRAAQSLAALSQKVYRVVCGIGVRIK